MNNEVLYFLDYEDIYIVVLSVLVSILNPNRTRYVFTITNKWLYRRSESEHLYHHPIFSISKIDHRRLEFDSESLGPLALVSVLRVAVYRLVPASLFPISSTVHSTDKRQVKYHVLYTVLIILCTVKGRFLCYHKNVVLFSQKPTDLLSDNCFGLPTSYPAEI